MGFAPWTTMTRRTYKRIYTYVRYTFIYIYVCICENVYIPCATITTLGYERYAAQIPFNKHPVDGFVSLGQRPCSKPNPLRNLATYCHNDYKPNFVRVTIRVREKHSNATTTADLNGIISRDRVRCA